MTEQLAQPVTVDQMYLAAILEELRALHSVVAPPIQVAVDVPLREPEKRQRGRPKKNRAAGA